MGYLHHSSTALYALTFFIAAGAAGASGAERLVMPFECSARDGAVNLTPSDDKSYRIYGVREHSIYTACAPANPDRCRNWMLHRFDLDCGGAKVSWLEVVEAASRGQPARVWVRDGRMSLQMGPLWVVDERDKPLNRRKMWHKAWRSQSAAAESFDPTQAGPRSVVELPPGFAPVMGFPAQFIAEPGEEIASAGIEASAGEASVQPQPSPPIAARSEPAGRAFPPDHVAAVLEADTAPESPAGDEPEEPAADAPAAPSGELEHPTPAPVQKAEKAPHSAAPVDAENDSLSWEAATTVTDRDGEAVALLDRAPVTGTSGRSSSFAPDASPDAAGDLSTNASVAATAPIPAPGAASATAPGRPAATSITTGSLKSADPSTEAPGRHPIFVVVIGLIAAGSLLASSIVLWSRRPEQFRTAAMLCRKLLTRNLSHVASDAGTPPSGTPAPVVQRGAKSQVNMKDKTPAVSNTGSIAAALTPNASHEKTNTYPLPKTLGDAHQIIKVGPNAPLAAIKDVVDGLRESWHPDRATSTRERRDREDRLRQIEAAWEIISAARSTP